MRPCFRSGSQGDGLSLCGSCFKLEGESIVLGNSPTTHLGPCWVQFDIFVIIKPNKD